MSRTRPPPSAASIEFEVAVAATAHRWRKEKIAETHVIVGDHEPEPRADFDRDDAAFISRNLWRL